MSIIPIAVVHDMIKIKVKSPQHCMMPLSYNYIIIIHYGYTPQLIYKYNIIIIFLT